MTKNKDDQYFIDQAIKLARERSDSGENGPFGAVIVRNGEIISRGWNTVVSSHDPTAHAEINAIRKAADKLGNNDLQGCTIYSSCEPCPMCFSAILWARLDRVVYSSTRQDAAQAGFDDQVILEEIKKDWKQRYIKSRKIESKEADQVFQNWIDNPDKKTY
ncbi:MAG TPA: nucleoside deaminase [bacterium]|nr:nucleoside deaminase [bacterium]